MCPGLFLPTTAERLHVSDFHCIWHPFISLTQRKWEAKTTNGLFSEWEWSSHVSQVERGTAEKCKGSVTGLHVFTDLFVFSVLKDQWIRAKYERREFTGENIYFQKVYSAGNYPRNIFN